MPSPTHGSRSGRLADSRQGSLPSSLYDESHEFEHGELDTLVSKRKKSIDEVLESNGLSRNQSYGEFEDASPLRHPKAKLLEAGDSAGVKAGENKAGSQAAYNIGITGGEVTVSQIFLFG